MTTSRQLSFGGGELAPSLHGRVDLVKYVTGLKTCRNFALMRHGGVTNRPGTEFVCEVADSSKVTRIIPFVVSSTTTYILEFSDLMIRVIKNGSLLSDFSITITGITNANPAVLTYTGTDPANGDHVRISGVVGMTEMNSRTWKVANVNTVANTFEVDYLDGTNLNSTSFGTYTSGGTGEVIYTITTTYAEADLFALKYIQSADVMTIVHPSYAPRELSRTADTSWTLSTISFVPSISTPSTPTGPAGTFNSYQVTAVKDETFEESLHSSTATVGTALPTPTVPVDINWGNVSGAREYNIYRADNTNEIYGLVGISGISQFRDIGTEPDYTETPPDSRNPFSGSGNWPSTVAYIQQRLMFANTTNAPEKVWGSRIGFFHNFTISTPIQDDDSVTFVMGGLQISKIKHLLDLGRLVILTETGEWVCEGASDGVLSPFAINPKQQGYNGAADIAPITVGSTALYIQARGSVVRDLFYNWQESGYRGKDLTIFSAHLFDNYTIVDWTYQQVPHSIVWIARDDGKLLGLTYIREHDLWGWHRHDTDGEFESLATVAEGNIDRVYAVINRTINGSTVRYIERFHSRLLDEIADLVLVDCSESYDGRHTGATTMTLSGGTNWSYDELLTLTASAATFASTYVGDTIVLTGSDGTIIRFTISNYSSTTVVTGHAHKTVPVSMRSVAISTWSRATDTITGIWHLEGEDVAVIGDGNVVANPNNPDIDTVTVTNGTVTLNANYSVIHIGLPYICDIQTLNIDNPQGETLMDKKKLVSKVTMQVEDTRGLWSGPNPPSDDSVDPIENLEEAKIDDDIPSDGPPELTTGIIDVLIQPEWNSTGSVFIRQLDPLPCSILAIAPAGLLPYR